MNMRSAASSAVPMLQMDWLRSEMAKEVDRLLRRLARKEGASGAAISLLLKLLHFML